MIYTLVVAGVSFTLGIVLIRYAVAGGGQG